MLFEIKDIDREFYNEYLQAFLPEKIIDIHTHVWLKHFIETPKEINKRTVSWPSLVAEDNSIEDMMETYQLLFPDKTVTPLIFSSPRKGIDIDKGNDYIQQCAEKHNIPSLVLAHPTWTADQLEETMLKGSFLGVKVYLSFARPDIPANDITIFDFLPHHQLEVLNNHGWIAMLHLPRPQRLKDPVNLEQMIEIEDRYPNVKVIIAHVGRAYCSEDLGNAFEVLSETQNMVFDISANTNVEIFEKLIHAVGPKRILFGSDMPITRMRMRRICENGIYINLVPKGLYGDVSGDKNMREVSPPDSDAFTFFVYEEIDAFRKAAENAALSRSDIEDIFYNNAKSLCSDAK